LVKWIYRFGWLIDGWFHIESFGMNVYGEQKKWIRLPNMSRPRYNASATQILHFIFIIGGAIDVNHSRVASNLVECFDLVTSQWTTQYPMLTCRSQHTTLAYDDYYIIVLGGYNEYNTVQSSCEMYNVVNNKSN